MSKKRLVLILVVVGLVAVSGVAYASWQGPLSSASAAGTPTSAYQTSAVRRADLAITVTGSGKVVASQTIDLSFPVSEKIAVLNVQLGDQVKAGDVLAVQEGLDELQLAVANQQLAVQTAQKALDDLQSNAAGNLAAASAAEINAQKAYDTAKVSVHYKGDNRCGQEKTLEYYMQYMELKGQAEKWQGYLTNPKDTDYGHDFILQNLIPLQKSRDLAYVNWVYCQGFTDQEILTSQANLQTASANLDQAKAAYALLQANNGIDPTAVQIAQATVKNAELQLQKAQDDLAGATLLAPVAGTVTAVNGSVGQASGTNTFITLAVMDTPLVQLNIDESDMENIGVGCDAQVSLTSAGAKAMAGKVTQISPQLVTSRSVTYVQTTVQIDKNALPAGNMLPLGLDVSVDVTCQQAKNALEVPTSAIYQTTGQPSYVYILNAQGKPEKREVVVGLNIGAFAEIKSGLAVGDQVITTKIP